MHSKIRIAIPEPTSFDPAYNQRGWPQYAHAVECSGGVAVPIPLTETLESIAEIIAGCAGILLPGSPADLDSSRFGQEKNPASADPDAKREAVDDLLLQNAFESRKPVLGICYGMQSMNVWRHGTLNQHIPGTGVDHAPGKTVDEAHGLKVGPGSRLAGILGEASTTTPTLVNSSHHQAVATPGQGFTVVAHSDQDGIVEAVELAGTTQFVLGVQWHPERTFGVQAGSRAIFAAFLEAAGRWKRAQGASASRVEAVAG